MKIAAAQIRATSDTTNEIFEQHLRMIDLASSENVALLVFPEMSLTGYERELAEQLAFTAGETRLEVFKDKAQEREMLIIVGAPIKIESTLHIGSFIFLPDRTTLLYTKQFLHDGEELYFTPSSTYNPLIEYQGERISFAICADISNPKHPLHASNRNTTLYVSSIFYSRDGIQEGHDTLSRYAKEYSMKILMANYTGSSFGIESGGRSGYWNAQGELVRQLNDSEESLLIIET